MHRLPALVIALAFVACAAFATFATFAPEARAQTAFPVRVAVVGFTGDLDAAGLSELAVSIRGSLQRQADPKVLAVVSREEMGAIYKTRGAACSPEDFQCIVEVSEAWAGRLFVRGVVRNTSEGIIVTATLESVRNFPVAASQTPVAKGNDVAVAVPILVRELLDGERAYREHAASQTRHPGAVRDDESLARDGAPASMPPGTAEPVTCRCLAIQSTYVPGDLVISDDDLRFESAPTSAVKLKWKYGWDKIGTIKATAHGANPALLLTAKNSDELVVYFNLGEERNTCLAHIERRRSGRR